ncbi:helix-turn-helix domain-containing protein [Spirosoma montaniterrae]|uniref:AraC family transcriptional regulator n=1 Tax=Spirosoma montaniterrae TaxID=1178516 RepID=A0A1P9WS62_9BACT|nr:AraC family transcriptional regulator [Spirosoma montaniterrae]AQG78225.1 AraC family transcriptional regulator [Spirosoma montaniterrae]
MKLYIKGMVSNSCKTIVRAALNDLGLHCAALDLGEVELDGIITLEQLSQVRVALLLSGHELIDDKRKLLVEKIKHTVIDLIHHTDEAIKVTNSDYISARLEYDYTYLANLFSEVTGNTIEHYIIAHKIERAKELLLYNELNLTQIANKLHYSSVAHLSTQFKKVTGLTPTLFRQLTHNGRIAHEDVGIV